ncbi:MAG: hypothetical protein LAO51_18840 [Acidobacteriia bacterium]|nr:hypothetical protein [Terriglobia bacterium]
MADTVSEGFLTPAMVSLAVSSIVSPVLFYFLKVREERRKERFDHKYAEYKAFLKALDDMAATARIDFESFMRDTMGRHFSDILRGGGDLEALNVDVREFTLRTASAFSKAKSELHGLTLVCSEKLLSLVRDFTALQERLMSRTTALLGDLKQFNTDSPVAAEMKELGERAESLKDEIVRAMRTELRIK